jgi:hypothetical protein
VEEKAPITVASVQVLTAPSTYAHTRETERWPIQNAWNEIVAAVHADVDMRSHELIGVRVAIEKLLVAIKLWNGG